MTDGIIIAILVVVLFIGLRSTVKHFTKKGGCCSSSDYKPKKKKLSKVQYRKTFVVEGMHCEHCKRRVEEAVNNIRGVAGVVNLKKRELTISYEMGISDEEIIAAVIKAGYQIIQ